MRSQTLDEFGLPNIVLYEDGNVFDTLRNEKLGNQTDPLIYAHSPSGAPKRLSKSKTIGMYFRAPWKNGIDYANLAMIDCSRYYATVDGRIFGKRNMNFVKPRLTPDGYEMVHLYTDSGDYQPWRVSRLIATAFIPNPEGKDTVDHIDGNRTNNKVSNLRWMWMWENDDKRRIQHGTPTEKIHEICRYLEAGMSQTQAAKVANVSRHVVKDLQYGSYYRITKNYNIPRYTDQHRLPVEFRGGKVGNHGQQNRVHQIVTKDFSSTTIL